MARLIDADALLKKLGDTSYVYYKTDEYIDGVFAGGISKAEIIVMQAPTIEAEPVRHGEWVMKITKSIRKKKQTKKPLNKGKKERKSCARECSCTLA